MTITGDLIRHPGSFVVSNTAQGTGGGISGGGFGNVTLNNDSVVQGNDPDDCEADIGSCT